MAVTYTPALAAGLGSAPPVKGDVRGWLEAIATAINTQLDPRATPIYATRAAAVSAAPSLPGTLNHIVTREGTALVVRERSASADDPLFGTAPRWGVVLRQDVAAETTARINATRDSGVLPLADVAGTDAITAVIDPSLTGITLSALSTVELIPAADNTGAATLNVGGAGAWPVQRGDGTPVEAGDLRAGVARHYRRAGSAWRMVGIAKSEAADMSAVMPLVLGGSGAAPVPRTIGWMQDDLSSLSEAPSGHQITNYPANTWIIAGHLFDAAGVVDRLECYAITAGTILLGVWTALPDGMALRVQKSFSLAAGYNSLDVAGLDVRAGEAIAIRQPVRIIPAAPAGSTLDINNYGWQLEEAGTTTDKIFGVSDPSRRGHAALWRVTVQVEDGAGANQPIRAGGLAADWILMGCVISGRESSGLQDAGAPAIVAVEDAFNVFPGKSGAVPAQFAPLTSTNFGPNDTTGGTGATGQKDNPFFHAIRAYRQLLRARQGVRATDFEHRVVAHGFGAHGAVSGAGIPNVFAALDTETTTASLGITAVLSRRLHRKVLPVLLNISGERDSAVAATAAGIDTMLTTAHDRWRAAVARERGRQAAEVPDPFRDRAPVFMGQYCRFEAFKHVTSGHLLHALSYPDLHFINPNYMIGIASGSDRNPTLDGVKRLGAHIGWTMYRALIEGVQARPLMMTGARVVGGRIIVSTNGADLVSDTTDVPAQVHHGLTVHNAAGVSQPISSVTIDGGRIIIDTIAPVAAGWTVRYGDAAMAGFDAGQAVTYGGNIREHPSDAPYYEGIPCVRWMAVHELTLPQPELASVVMTATDYAALGGIYAPNTLYHLTEG